MQIDRQLAERRRKQNKRRNYFWGIIFFLVAYFLLLGIFLFVVRLPAFQAQRITIEGNSAIPQTAIMNLLQASVVRQNASLDEPNSHFKSLLGFNNMLIWPDVLPSSTVAAIPQLAGVTIAKNYFLHTITVTVTEREPFAVWCLMPSDHCFWFDNQGTAFGKTLDTQGNAIFVIHDYTQTKLMLEDKVMPEEFMPNLISIVNTLMASGLNVQETALRDLSLQQIDVTTANGPMISFSLRFPASEDLAVLKSIIAKPGFAKLQYIDFTVKNRAYYK